MEIKNDWITETKHVAPSFTTSPLLLFLIKVFFFLQTVFAPADTAESPSLAFAKNIKVDRLVQTSCLLGDTSKRTCHVFSYTTSITGCFPKCFHLPLAVKLPVINRGNQPFAYFCAGVTTDSLVTAFGKCCRLYGLDPQV